MHKGGKNILLLIPTFADEGGTQKVVYELGKVLSEKHNVYECSYDAFGEPHIFKNNNQVLTLASPHGGSIIKKISSYPLKISRLRKIKKEYKIDITISNLWSADLVNILSGSASKTISIGHINIIGNVQNKLLLKYKKLGKFIYNKFDKVVAVNEILMRELSDLFEIPAEKMGFINNFIAFPAVSKQTVNRHPFKKRLINVGRLNPIKNQEPLLLLLRNLKKNNLPIQLIIVGTGPLEEQLHNKARELDLKTSNSIDELEADIIFTGFKDPYGFLWSADIFVFSSLSEGFGLVLVEAMYTNLPIITSDCPTGGPHMILEARSSHQPERTEIEETKYGYLMPIPHIGNESSLYKWEQVVSELLKNDDKRLQMGQAGNKRSLDFGVNVIKNEWFRIIDEIIKS